MINSVGAVLMIAAGLIVLGLIQGVSFSFMTPARVAYTAAAVGPDARLGQGAVQRRLVALQQGQGLGPFGDDLDRSGLALALDAARGARLAVVLLIIVVLVLLFLFRDQLGFGGNKTNINVPDKIDVTVNQN